MFFIFFLKKTLKTKHSIILANCIFAVNFLLVKYATEFKQYSTDVLFFMVSIIFACSIPKKLQIMDVLKYGFVFTMLFFASQPTIFVAAGYVLYNFSSGINGIKKKKLSTFVASFFIAFIPFCFALFYRCNISKAVRTSMKEYWQDGFINFSNFLNLIKINTDFFAWDTGYYKWVFALLVLFGFIIFIFKKSKINLIILSTLIVIFFGSILKIYPFHTRLIVYLLPLFIIFVNLCFDFRLKQPYNKFLNSGIAIFIVIFLSLFQLKILYPDRINNLHYNSTAGMFFKTLKREINMENEYIIMTDLSKFVFDYYCALYNFDESKVKIVFISLDNEEYFSKGVKNIKEGDIAWLYLGYKPDIDNYEEKLIKMAKKFQGFEFQNNSLYKLYF